MISFTLSGVLSYCNVGGAGGFWLLTSGNLNNLQRNPATLLLAAACFTPARCAFLVYTPQTHPQVVYAPLQVSPELLIGYYNTHPYFFYLSLAVFFCKYLGPSSHNYVKVQHWFWPLLALFLGALWGWGNSVWGFFWVNDTIEMTLLIFVVFVFTTYHSKTSLKSTSSYPQCLLILVIWLWLLRKGFIFSRHSFFSVGQPKNILGAWLLGIIQVWVCTLFQVSFSYTQLLVFTSPWLLGADAPSTLKQRLSLHRAALAFSSIWILSIANNTTYIKTKSYKNFEAIENRGGWLVSRVILAKAQKLYSASYTEVGTTLFREKSKFWVNNTYSKFAQAIFIF